VISINILHTKPDRIMDIVRELRTMGMVQGKDFDFAFNQASYNNDSWEAVSPRCTVFYFYTEKYATFFALKYTGETEWGT